VVSGSHVDNHRFRPRAIPAHRPLALRAGSRASGRPVRIPHARPAKSSGGRKSGPLAGRSAMIAGSRREMRLLQLSIGGLLLLVLCCALGFAVLRSQSDFWADFAFTGYLGALL